MIRLYHTLEGVLFWMMLGIVLGAALGSAQMIIR
jgi:hypothetical protein